jgi:hypothetical protein
MLQLRHNSIKWLHSLSEPVSIGSLAFFRVLFGAMMVASLLRFWLKGWIATNYLETQFAFKFYGFEWVSIPPAPYLYLLFAITGLAALLIMLGAFYRVASIIFFLGFTYLELLDKSYYLNHYYFVSVVAFILCWLPAHRAYALDACWWPSIRQSTTPRWMLGTLRLQLGIVYVYAGLAKINPDWLLAAQPLRLWLPPHTSLPLIGPLMDDLWLAYGFSWFGCVYDLTIPFWLMWSRSRPLAYLAVLVFHLMTALLFPIGMFPYIMIGATLIFFPTTWHDGVMKRLVGLFANSSPLPNIQPMTHSQWAMRGLIALFVLHFSIQFIWPFRYLAYPGPLFWREEGYRFSWRVMLIEKAGYATFYVVDKTTGKRITVVPSSFLNPHQEKQMSTQPDMILEFAHFLRDHYRQQGLQDPAVYAEVFVTLNGKGSRLMINPTNDLAAIRASWGPQSFILPFDLKAAARYYSRSAPSVDS